ncbi:MAG TPA: ABC transporter substrate-binding protein [Alphaproteobacteria bacterium]|nr:ABC transporter substrate-binding protein [Alphaproteobacteria bacterium]
MRQRASSRRSFLRRGTAAAGLAALASTGFRRARAAGLRQVNMRLDWLYQGPNAGFMVAQRKGFYKDAGLDVDVGTGKGSGSTAQLVATKATQFGFSDGFSVGFAISKGASIRMVGAVYRRNPTAIVVLADSGITKAKDLEGKTLAIPTGGAGFQQWPAFAKGCGVDTSNIKVVNTDPAGTPPALITGKVDGIGGFAQGFVPSVEIRGNKKARILWYADCGVTAVSNGIIVHPDLIKEDPGLIRAFVAASIKGFLYDRQHPEETCEIVKSYSEAVDLAITRRELEISWTTWVTPNTAGKPLGWMSEKDWQATVDVLKQYGGVGTPLTPADIYTNDYVPSGAEFVPPQT